MKLYLKVGTMPGVWYVAPKLRKAPWVGASFEVREMGVAGAPLETVRLTEIRCPNGDGSGIHYTEGCSKSHVWLCERI